MPREKSPATPGFDSGIFRLVAQCLNHYATPDPPVRAYFLTEYSTLIFVWPFIIIIDGKEESQIDAIITIY